MTKKEIAQMKALLAKAEKEQAEQEPEEPEEEEEEEVVEEPAPEPKAKKVAKKKKSILKRFLPTRGEQEEEEEEPEPEDTSQQDRMAEMQAQMDSLQWDRTMDELEIPKSRKIRRMFMALLDQKIEENGGKEPSDEDMAEILDDIDRFSGVKKKAKKEEPEDDEVTSLTKKLKEAKAKRDKESKEEPEEEEGEEEEAEETKATSFKFKGQKNKVTKNKEQLNLQAFIDMGQHKRQVLADNNPELYERFKTNASSK